MSIFTTGNELFGRIKGDVKRARAALKLWAGLGGFGALCALPTKYKEPVLVSGMDGVGTKLRLAIDLKTRYHRSRFSAMCVNDLIVQGQNRFSLDYYATGNWTLMWQ